MNLKQKILSVEGLRKLKEYENSKNRPQEMQMGFDPGMNDY